MKVSSIIVGALAAVVSATPIPGKEISKRGAFGTANILGSLTGAFDFNLVNNFAFADPLLAHLALVNNLDQNIFSNLAINNNLAFDGLAQTLLLQQGAGFGSLSLSSLLDIHSLALLSWLGNNGLLNGGFDIGGLQLPSALSFGLIDQFGIGNFAFDLAIDQVIQQQILASLSNSLLFSGVGGFGGGAAVVSSVQSTVIVKE